MDDCWGAWVEHDGKGCPCVGKWVQVVWEDLGEEPLPGGLATGSKCWDWKYFLEYDPIIRYRIRKPRGLTILENLLRDLPAPTREHETTGAAE